MTYVIQCHVKVAQILSGCGAYLNLDKEMNARTAIIDSKLNLKLSQDSLDRVYLDLQCDTFTINNALVYQIVYKMFTDMDAYVYVKQRKGMKNG